MGVGRQKGLMGEGGGEKSSFIQVLSKHQESKRNHVTFVCLRISPDVSWSQSACSTQPKQKAPIHHPCQPSTPAAQPKQSLRNTAAIPSPSSLLCALSSPEIFHSLTLRSFLPCPQTQLHFTTPPTPTPRSSQPYTTTRPQPSTAPTIE